MGASRYGISPQVLNQISDKYSRLTREISSTILEEKFHLLILFCLSYKYIHHRHLLTRKFQQTSLIENGERVANHSST